MRHAPLFNVQRRLDCKAKNNKILREISVLTLRLKRRSTLSPILSTENSKLACLLHLQLNAPLARFKKHLHLTWFESILCNAFFHGFAFCLQDGHHLEAHAHAMHGYFTTHVLIDVFRILEGASAHHVSSLLKFGFPHWDPPTEEKKSKQRKYRMKNKALASR